MGKNLDVNQVEAQREKEFEKLFNKAPTPILEYDPAGLRPEHILSIIKENISTFQYSLLEQNVGWVEDFCVFCNTKNLLVEKIFRIIRINFRIVFGLTLKDDVDKIGKWYLDNSPEFEELVQYTQDKTADSFNETLCKITDRLLLIWVNQNNIWEPSTPAGVCRVASISDRLWELVNSYDAYEDAIRNRSDSSEPHLDLWIKLRSANCYEECEIIMRDPSSGYEVRNSGGYRPLRHVTFMNMIDFCKDTNQIAKLVHNYYPY
jgi:hypothetical protein